MFHQQISFLSNRVNVTISWIYILVEYNIVYHEEHHKSYAAGKLTLFLRGVKYKKEKKIKH